MKYLSIATAAMSMLAASPVNATELVITYYGTVRSGFDYVGDLGFKSTDLTGKAFTATYVYRPSDASYFKATPSGWTDLVSPGRITPLLYSSLTIDGKTTTFSSVQHGGFQITNSASGATLHSLSVLEVDKGWPFYEATFFNANSIVTDGDLFPTQGKFNYTSADTLGSIVYARQLFRLEFNSAYSQIVYSKADLKVDRVFIQSTGAVPEPGTWMMMIIGFGAVGYAMRRKSTIRFA